VEIGEAQLPLLVEPLEDPVAVIADNEEPAAAEPEPVPAASE
jgi:hypothetical protein